MSNENPPKQRRSFRVIFKLIKFVIAMVLTFCISFAVTLYLKTDEPTDLLDSYAEEVFAEEEEIVKTANAPEIKTLFDERNKQPFGGTGNEELGTSRDKGQGTRETSQAVDTAPQPARQAEDIGLLATLDRMTSIKPAVDEKLKTIPHYTTLTDMPQLLCQAVVAVEDTRFYTHKGFDMFGIARAVLVNVEAGEIQEGASTITQQTVKNLFLTSDQTFTRKAEELVLSMNMEKDFDKNKILEIYLNVIYFGSNYYGIHDAAQGYFGKTPADLTLAECAMLAGLPNAPSLYSPYVDYHLAKKRQLVVIDAMEKSGVISSREAENARIEEIILAH